MDWRIIVAAFALAGCGTGTETGKDGEGAFGKTYACEGNETYTLRVPEGSAPFILMCDSDADDTWDQCSQAYFHASEDKVRIDCNNTDAVYYVRWL